MALTISTLAANRAGDSIVDLIDIGSLYANGFIEIRTGTKPTSVATPATGTLLATCAFSNPAYGDFTNRVALSNAISDDNTIDASGVAGWFRIYDRDGLGVIDGTIGLVDSGADLEFDDLDFKVGGRVSITQLNGVM